MNIKIIVACHKPSELPKNDLFLPVQVGATNATKKLPFQQDDDGENISDKNPSYCELTAQYWAWKNLDIDYYGLCHYRRFLCLHDIEAKQDRRNQIQAGVMDTASIHRFGLDDEAEMRKIIEQNDVIIGEEQDVRRLYTPRGAQTTAYDHWAAHDRALIMKKDLDKMLDILCEVSPEVGAATREYLSGSTFLGFNCFILRKDLFQQLCDIEFTTLERLEKEVDTTHYCQQLSRIYGFMGEIISSGFFYYLNKTGKYKIKRVPLVYFNYTEPISYLPLRANIDNHHIPVIFDYVDTDPLLFAVAWRSFLDHINESVSYDVCVVADFEDSQKDAIARMSQEFKNITIRFIDTAPMRAYLKDVYGLYDSSKKVAAISSNPEIDQTQLSLLPFFPYFFDGYKRAIIVDKNTLVCDDISKIWQQYNNTKSCIVAPPNVYIQSRINDIYSETSETYISQHINNLYKYFNVNIFVLDFEKYRNEHSEQEVVNLYHIKDEPNIFRSKEEIMNILCEGSSELMDVRWSVWYEASEHLKYQLPYAPLRIYQEMLKSRKDPGMITYLSQDPWETNFSIVSEKFWDAARRTPFYEHYIQHGTELILYRSKHHRKDLMGKLLPVDGKMRAKLTRVLPQGSKRNKKVKDILTALKLR